MPQASTRRRRSCAAIRFSGEGQRGFAGFGIGEDEADAFLAALQDLEPMNFVQLGEYSISDEILVANGFTAV
jgi:hypothetical protein